MRQEGKHFQNMTRREVRHLLIFTAFLFALFSISRPAPADDSSRQSQTADSINWYNTERSLGVQNCVISNAERGSIRVEDISPNLRSVSLLVGQATQLTCALSPAHAANREVTWKSSNAKVAKVSKSGWVIGRKKGSCRITCTTKDGKKKAVCRVTVKKASGAASARKLLLSKAKLTLYTGQAKQLFAKLRTPLASTPLIWASSSPQVAEVDPSGRVTGLRSGSAVITARALKGGATVSCRVTVKGRYPIRRLPWQLIRGTLSTARSAQGSGVNNGTYFKLWNYNAVQLYNFSTGALIAEFSLDSRHGNLIDFDTASAAAGPYHDAYITAETNPAMVNVYRFSNSSAERIRTYIFPLEKTGYNAGHVLDPVNRLIYLVGYTKNSFYNPAGNDMIISVWDITSTTEVRAGFFRPRFVRSFRLPFMLTLQGECLKDGRLYILSSDWPNAWSRPDTVIYVVDLASSSIEEKIAYLPAELKRTEMESIFFLGDALYIDKDQYIYRIQL